MTTYSKESLDKLLYLIDAICLDNKNSWFKEKLRDKITDNIHSSQIGILHNDLRRTKSFLKYIDGQFWKEGFNFYKKIKDANLKIALTSDFKEMKIAEADKNLQEFVRRLILQIENILNFLIIKFNAHQIIKDSPQLYQNDKFDLVNGNYSFFLVNGDDKLIKNISIGSKIKWLSIFFGIRYTYSDWNEIVFIRNKASHREKLNEDESIKLEQIEDNADEKFVSYSKFLKLLINKLIDHT